MCQSFQEEAIMRGQGIRRGVGFLLAFDRSIGRLVYSG